MASRISQMRSEMSPPYQQMSQPQIHQQLNESIDRTRALMQQMQNMPNTEQIIMNILQQNPQLAMIQPMLRNGNSLESIARGMAQAKNLDINEVIRGLYTGQHNL